MQRLRPAGRNILQKFSGRRAQGVGRLVLRRCVEFLVPPKNSRWLGNFSGVCCRMKTLGIAGALDVQLHITVLIIRSPCPEYTVGREHSYGSEVVVFGAPSSVATLWYL